MYSTQLCWLLTVAVYTHRISNIVCQQFSWDTAAATRLQTPVIPQRFQLPGGVSVATIATSRPQPTRDPSNAAADGSDYEISRKLGGPAVSPSTDSVRTAAGETFSPNANPFGRERHGHVHSPTSTTDAQQPSSDAHQQQQQQQKKHFTRTRDSSSLSMSMSPPSVIANNDVEEDDYESDDVTSTSAVSFVLDTTFIGTEKSSYSVPRTSFKPASSSSSIRNRVTNSQSFTNTANIIIEEEEAEDKNQFPRNKDRIPQTSSTGPDILQPSVRRTLPAVNSAQFASKQLVSRRPNFGNQASLQIAQNKIVAVNYERAPPKATVADKLDVAEKRTRKPVAQVLKRYREDNADGSITWGFENDDGSYKEETIGNDCVTRGKYGYIDPDGVRREYSYSQGLPCHKHKLVRGGGQTAPTSAIRKDDDNDDETRRRGPLPYIDYSINKVVLPNGDSLDLNNMVKNRARKPVQNLKNY